MTQIKTWLLCFSIVMGVLYLNAALERPETDDLTAQVSNDRAAEWVAINNPARVASKAPQ